MNGIYTAKEEIKINMMRRDDIMYSKKELFDKLRGGLIVSCQALPDEPLYSSYIMSRMAFAAKEGGAKGIRANTPEDISAIRETVDLPVIGLYKSIYEDSEVYITPTEKEVDALMAAKPDIIAMDATNRVRPGGTSLYDFFKKVREKYPDMIFMADCSTYEDGVYAEKIGFDIVGTTMSGYTKDTKGTKLPNFNMVEKLTEDLHIPVIAEGGIWEAVDLQKVFNNPILAAVIGTAITRPREITSRYVKALNERKIL